MLVSSWRVEDEVPEAKLEVGPASDPYEVEADAVAHQVVASLRSMSSISSVSGEPITSEAGENHGTISIRVVVLKPKTGDEPDEDADAGLRGKVDVVQNKTGTPFDQELVRDRGAPGPLIEAVWLSNQDP